MSDLSAISAMFEEIKETAKRIESNTEKPNTVNNNSKVPHQNT